MSRLDNIATTVTERIMKSVSGMGNIIENDGNVFDSVYTVVSNALVWEVDENTSIIEVKRNKIPAGFNFQVGWHHPFDLQSEEVTVGYFPAPKHCGWDKLRERLIKWLEAAEYQVTKENPDEVRSGHANAVVVSSKNGLDRHLFHMHVVRRLEL